jgi:hypothetical protein
MCLSVRRLRTTLWLAFLATACLRPLIAASQQVPDRDTLWREDLKVFAEEFAAGQKDFQKLYPRPDFEGTLKRLSQRVAPTDADMVLDLMRLVASGHVAHSGVLLPTPAQGFTTLPVGFHWYADGLAIVAATPEFRPALGARVLRIGGKTPESLLEDVAPYISFETPIWLKTRSTAYLASVPVLNRLGVLEANGGLRIALQKGDAPFDIDIPTSRGEPPPARVWVFDKPGVPVPLARKHPARLYWHEYLPGSNAIYIEYSKCSEDASHPFAQFTSEVLADIDAHDVDRVLLDIRTNPGGNSSVIAPLTAGLKARPKLRSRIFVLIGPETFSSGQLAAWEFRRKLGATLVGESMGEALNSYGEVKQFTLPHSHLRVQYSTKYFRLGSDDVLDPQIRVAATLEDVLAGRDPVLDAALSTSLPPRHK